MSHFLYMSTAKSLLIFICLISISQSITAVMRSKAHIVLNSLNTGIMGLTLTGALLYVSNFLCCFVLCTQRPCDGLIPHPRRSTKYQKDV
jgi:hypothetical protein